MSVCVDGCILSEWMSDAWAAFEWWNICLWCFLTKLDLTQGSKIFETFNGRLTVHISLSDLTMSIIRKDNSFKLIHLNWFLGWTFVLDSSECGNILATRNSADPKVIFVQCMFSQTFSHRGYPALTLTRRLPLQTGLELSVFRFYCAAIRTCILEFLDSSQWYQWCCTSVVSFLRCIGARQVTTPRVAVQFGPRSDPGDSTDSGSSQSSPIALEHAP